MKNIGLVTVMVAALLRAEAQVPVWQAPPQGNPGESAAGSGSVAPANISPGVGDVIKLAESGASDDVLLAFIQNAQAPFNLSADGVIYLRDMGISSAVITAILNRDTALRGQPGVYVYDQKQYGQPGQQPPPVTPAPESAPAPTEPPPAPVDSQPAPSDAGPPPTYVSTPPPVEVNYFYNDLSPYGSWVMIDGFGWCWQPRAVVVNRGWRPYCDGGHWVYTDCGWYWQSDYSWGWAPFHYGRWYLHERCGWVWCPDTTWGPAWVVWRSAGDNCGWAPVPPHAVFDVRLGWRFNGVAVGLNFDFGLRPEHFTFVAAHDFADHDLRHRELPVKEVRNVYNHTTIINNYTVEKNVVVNRGFPVEHIAAVTHKEFKPITVREAPAGDKRIVHSTGDNVAVYRPQLKEPAHISPVVAQKVDASHPVIQHQVNTVPVRQTKTSPVPEQNFRHTPTQMSTAPTQRAVGEKPPVSTPVQHGVEVQKPVAKTPTLSAHPLVPTPQPQEVHQSTTPVLTPRVAGQRPPSPAAQNQPGQPGAYQLTTKNPEPNNQQGYQPKSYHQAAEIHSLNQGGQNAPGGVQQGTPGARSVNTAPPTQQHGQQQNSQYQKGQQYP